MLYSLKTTAPVESETDLSRWPLRLRSGRSCCRHCTEHCPVRCCPVPPRKKPTVWPREPHHTAGPCTPPWRWRGSSHHRTLSWKTYTRSEQWDAPANLIFSQPGCGRNKTALRVLYQILIYKDSGCLDLQVQLTSKQWQAQETYSRNSVSWTLIFWHTKRQLIVFWYLKVLVYGSTKKPRTHSSFAKLSKKIQLYQRKCWYHFEPNH